jgi:glutathione S-transferase
MALVHRNRAAQSAVRTASNAERSGGGEGVRAVEGSIAALLVATMLHGLDYACGTFSVADAYLFAVLNWSTVTPVDLKPFAAITSHQARMRARPCVARAFAEERALFTEEHARHARVNALVRPPLPKAT